jgi:hypothetical protein
LSTNSFLLGLTNFQFNAIDPDPSGWGFVLALDIPDNKVYIKPNPDYQDVESRLCLLKTVEVTSEVVIEAKPGMNVHEAQGIANNLCNILSIARGTVVQWVYIRELDDKGCLARKTYYSRFTTRFSPAAVINPMSGSETKDFVRLAYPVYLERRGALRLDQGVIKGYLEGKADDDFLERRGVKLAVAMETLKHAFLRPEDITSTEFTLDPKQFGKLRTKIKEAVLRVLESAGVTKEDCQSISEKIGDLNRVSFKQVLWGLFNAIQFQPSKAEVDLFVRCRNALVHKGDFHSPSIDELKLMCRVPASSEGGSDKLGNVAVIEYFFLLNFVDRVFLKLLGYSGLYIDTRIHSPTHVQVGGYAVLE